MANKTPIKVILDGGNNAIGLSEFVAGDTTGVNHGGTGQTAVTTGDLLVGDAGNTLTKLAIGTNTQVLTSNGSTAVWSTPTGGTGFTGSQGAVGYTGSASTVAGPTGFTGSASTVAGPTGFTGSQGANGVGFTGSQGIQGVIGYTGSAGAGGSIAVLDEGVSLTSTAASLNFVGTGITATNVGNDVTVTVSGGTGFTGSQGAVGFTGSASTVAGPTGFTGSASTVAGPTGFTGSIGNTGFTGSAGAGGSIAVLDEGVSLTATAASLNFVGTGVTATTVGNDVTVTIPAIAGFTGSQGAVGFTGSASTVAGPTGFTGSASTVAGPTGFTGSASTVAGPTGFTGSASTVAGPTGFTGSASTVAGPTGFTGSQGGVGFTGSGASFSVLDESVSLTTAPTSMNFTGTGVTASNVGGAVTITIPANVGFTGSQGVIGFTGSASTVAGPTGFTGSASTVAGPTGFTGSQGANGVGFTGSQGIQGVIGFTGSAGGGGGGGGSPGGATTQIQYNNAGAFAGSATFTYTGDVTLNTGYYLGDTGVAIDSPNAARPGEFAHNMGATTYVSGTLGTWETMRLMNNSTTVNAASGFSYLVGGEIVAGMAGIRTGTDTGYMEALIAQTGAWEVSARFDSTGIKIPVAGHGLTLNASTTVVATPAAGNVTLFGKNIANRILPASMGPSALDAALQPSMWRQKIAMWNPPGNATTVPGVYGIAAPTAVGTATARNVASTNLLTRTRRLGYVSAATAGALTGHYNTTAQFSTGNGSGLGGFFYSCRFACSDAASVAGVRMFVGVTSSVAAFTNVEPSTLTNCIGIAQLSTDSTQLYLVYGGSAAQTAVALGTTYAPYNGAVGVTTGNLYDLTIFCPPNSNGVVNIHLEKVGTASVYTNTITPGTPGTQTPANTTFLAHRAWRTNNATAAAVGLDILQYYIETDY